MKRIIYKAVFLLLLLNVSCAQSQGQKKEQAQNTDERPNILFIFADDQCFSTINKLGNSEVTQI